MNIRKLFTRNGLLNLLAVAAPVAAGVISGGVFTLPVLVTAIGSIAAKVAPSLSDDMAAMKASRDSSKACPKDKNGQCIDSEDPK